jgi:transposase InsO family protein
LDLCLPNEGIQPITLSRVLYVPGLPINLLSSNNFRAKGVFFSNRDCTFRRIKDNKPFGFAPIRDGLNILRLASAPPEAPNAFGLLASHKDSSASPDQPSVPPRNSTDMTDLWHKRLGHPGLSSMRKIQAATRGLTNVRLTQLPTCEVCSLSKSERKVSRTPQRRAAKPLQRIHIDLIGHVKPETNHGQEYIVVITDDFSRYRWTFFISVKGDAHQTVVDFIKWSKLHCDPFQVMSVRLDQGTEFGVKSLQSFCRDSAIDLQYSAAYTPEQNGIAEASNKVILTKARAMMIDSGLPQHMWNRAVVYATYIANRSASRWVEKSPYQLFWNDIRDSDNTVDLSHLRRFGCIVYCHKPPNQIVKSEKFAPRAVRGYLLGMQGDSNTNYKIWIPGSCTILHTPHVTFDEARVYKDKEDRNTDEHHPNTTQSIEFETIHQNNSDPLTNQGVRRHHSDSNQHDSPPSPSSGGDTSAPGENASQPEFEDAPDDESDISDNITVTQPHQDAVQSDDDTVITLSGPRPAEGRSHRAIPRPDYRALHYGHLASALLAQPSTPFVVTEPSSYKQALSGPQSEHWYASMQREIKQLEDQNTWQVVQQLPPGRVLIKGRWVFKLKRNPDHSIKEYKSRWVAKGFMQEEGIDYFETYAATLRSGTFRTVFSLVAHYGWPLYQADITGAFLHSLLQDEIYMEAPHGFYTGQICKLLKSLYGLKQAPYLWYHALAKALEALGFLCLNADQCVFTNKEHDVFVLVFVDDLQITGPNTSAINALRAGLKTKFTLKEFDARTFLGLQIERNPSESLLRLHQRPYAERILQEFGFRDSKPVSTPMLEHSLLTHEGNVDITLQKWYRKVVGSLNHLATHTRPDLAYAISCLSRHLENPNKDHEAAAKRVLRYLNGTLDTGITFQCRSNEPMVFGYSDSDWAGDAETRRSTSGYAFFVAGGLVSWTSRRQSIVTLSSTEAEYVALTETFREAAWLRGLLTELGFEKSSLEPLLVLEDNQSTIQLTTNHANSNRTKHVDVRNHYCRQEYNSGHVDIQYVPTDLQTADGFTKPLKPIKWQHFLSLLRLSFHSQPQSV